MNLHKFTVVISREDQGDIEEEEVILFNLDHLVSIKPIQMVNRGEVITAYWVRTIMGKKYRAIKVPKIIEEAFQAE